MIRSVFHIRRRGEPRARGENRMQDASMARWIIGCAVWTRPKAKSPSSLGGVLDRDRSTHEARHTIARFSICPIPPPFLAVLNRPCLSRARTRTRCPRWIIWPVGESNIPQVYDLLFPYRSFGVIDSGEEVQFMMFSGKLKCKLWLIVENERLKFLVSFFRLHLRV